MNIHRHFLTASACLLAIAVAGFAAETSNVKSAAKSKKTKEVSADAFTLVVMDPLAAPLSCPCVEGYAQRKYEALAEHLESQLGEPVRVIFNESLVKAVSGDTNTRTDLVIGKDSVVRADAASAKRGLNAIGRLTDKLGSTQQHGLIVVPAKDSAQSIGDLEGYEIFFGPAECDEKHGAAMELLKRHNVSIPEKLTTCSSCSDGAATIVERGPKGKSAAVISSYAAPLLEGCGTIKKGDLRVLGKTTPVPFVTAFISEDVPAEKQLKVQLALTSMADKPELCQALESLAGFLPVVIDESAAKKK